MDVILTIIFGAGLIFFLIMLIMNKDATEGAKFEWAINFVNKESNDIVNISNEDGHGAINLMDRNGNYGWRQSGKVK